MYITFVHVLHAAVIIIDNYDSLVALPLMPVCLLVQKKDTDRVIQYRTHFIVSVLLSFSCQ